MRKEFIFTFSLNFSKYRSNDCHFSREDKRRNSDVVRRRFYIDCGTSCLSADSHSRMVFLCCISNNMNRPILLWRFCTRKRTWQAVSELNKGFFDTNTLYQMRRAGVSLNQIVRLTGTNIAINRKVFEY